MVRSPRCDGANRLVTRCMQARCGTVWKVSRDSLCSIKDLGRLLTFRSMWVADGRRALSSSCEQAALYDLSWWVEDGRGLEDSGAALNNSGDQCDVVTVYRIAYAFIPSLGVKRIEITGHGFGQAVCMPCRVELKSRRAGNTVFSSANSGFELQEMLFELATELDTFRILEGGRPYNSSSVSAIRLDTKCIKLTGTLRR